MARGSRTITQKTHLECEECNHVMTIHRRRNRLREYNHVKHMYCPMCEDTTGHIEKKDELFIPSWIDEWQKEQEEKRRV